MTIDKNSSSPFEVVSVDPLDETLAGEAWQQLCEASLDPNPFFAPAFLRPFLENMPGQAVRLVVVRNKASGEWMIAAPVGRRRLGLVLPVNATWATEYAPLGTPLMRPEAGSDAVQLFLKASAGPTKILAIPYLPLDSQTAKRLIDVPFAQISIAAETERAGHGAGPQGQAQLEEAFSGKRRKEMRRLLRRLGDHGDVQFETLSGQGVRAGFDAFLELEKRGWKGRSGTALLSRSQTSAFAKAAIENRAKTNGVRIDQLWAGDTLVASLVLFREGGNIYSWKIAFDEDYARYSPGAQIAVQSLRENLSQPDFKEADSLAIPGHSMIEPLWRGRLRTGTLLIGQGSLSGVMQAMCAADLSLGQALRQLGRNVKKRIGAYTSALA
ncbi:Protein involved in cellulose biosynthesis (CelD) [Roseibium album]|nr:Protein involved in cellulose biosynthesis (CelD) [Roseibium album]